MNIKGRKFDAELAHDLADERTEVLRVLAGALAEQPDIHLGYEELLDPVVLATRAAGRIRHLAAALELASIPVAIAPGKADSESIDRAWADRAWAEERHAARGVVERERDAAWRELTGRSWRDE
jgi:hypothetical protein